LTAGGTHGTRASQDPDSIRALLLSYEVGANVYGGLGRHVTSLSQALVERGASVHVATLGRDDDAGPDGPAGVHVHPTPPIPRVGRGDDWLACLLAFDSMLPTAAAHALGDADVVHAHDWLVARTAIALSQRLPLVVTVHATERGRHQGWLPDAVSRFVDAAERWLAASAAEVIVCTQAMRAAVIAQWSLDPRRISVVPNAPRADVVPRDPEPGRLLFAGRLEHEKGGQVLLAAVRRLRSRGISVHAVIAGTGSHRSAWERITGDLGIDDAVSFSGHLDWDQLALEYARAAVVVVPSLYEPSGMVAAEAMAAGAPLVASAVDGLVETVGDGGLLLPAQDDAALADGLERLLTSASARARAQDAAQRRAAQLPTWRDVADATMAVYAKAMNRRSVWTG
jgi:glycogen(starch) synthase